MINKTSYTTSILRTSTLILGLACAVVLRAEIVLPAIFSDHMVLQRAAKVPIWGQAFPGEGVIVTIDGQTVKATADGEGRWKAVLNLQTSGPGPFEMQVEGRNVIRIADVVVGEVWLASGQSNMEFKLDQTIYGPKEVAASDNVKLRHFQVKTAALPAPTRDLEGTWEISSPATSGGFSAVGYFFARELQKNLGVPVGIINASVGATPSEAWTSEQALNTVPALKAGKERILQEAKDYPSAQVKFSSDFARWLKDMSREDKATGAWEADSGTDGWEKVTLPGDLKKAGTAGVLWLRRTVDIPQAMSGRSPRLDMGLFGGVSAVFWNGSLIKKYTAEESANANTRQAYDIPASLIKTGANVLTIRLYAPLEYPVLSAPIKLDALNLAGDWEIKSETQFPALTAEARSSFPAMPPPALAPRFLPYHLFNGMIHPLIPYALRGVIWYQGEANSPRAFQYRTAFPLLIEDWRTRWGQESLPFYFCQLANFKAKSEKPGDHPWAEMREAQAMALKLPQTGQAVLIDLGEAGDIHPRNKKDVGQRLAKIALAKDYGQAIPFSGPAYQSMKVEGNKIRLTFKSNGGGLVAKPVPSTHVVKSLKNETASLVRNSPNSELEGFAVCASDQKWVWADAKIEGEDVIVWADSVSAPVAVRYAWGFNPTGNLYNAADLPASPFRTDDFPAKTADISY